MPTNLLNYIENFDQSQVEYLLKNYTISSLGKKHPSLPTGYLIRDQGIIDIFSGFTKLGLDIEGFALLKAAKYVGISGGLVRLKADSFDKIIIQNRRFTATAYNKIKLPFLKDKLDGLYVMNSSTRADPNTGVIEPKIPLTDIFFTDSVFEDSVELATYETEMIKLWGTF